jgi:O-antigen/teichoic acid export membrane protein
MLADTCPRDASVAAASAPPIRIVPISISQNVAWTASSSVMYALCQWGTLVSFARLGTPEGLGQFAFALALSAPVMMFLQLQLRTVQVTDAQDRFALADYLALRVVSSTVGTGVVLALAAATGGSPATIAVAALVAGVKALDGVADVLHGAWQKLERLDVPAKLLTLNGVASLAALALALVRGASVPVAVAGSLAGSAVALAAAAWVTHASLRESLWPAPGVLRRMHALCGTALPLGLVMALISLTANIPRYFIQHSLGERELGVFAALTYVIAAGTTLVSAVGYALTPGMARAFDAGDSQAFIGRAWKLVSIAAAIGVASTLLAALFARPLLQFAYGAEYAGSADVFVRAMASGTLTYMAAAVGFAMSAARCFRAQAPLFVVVVATVFAGSAVWIPANGLHGAVSALMLAAAVQLALGSAVLARAIGRGPSRRQAQC